VRPHSDPRRKPRHNMIIRGKGTPGGLMGRSPGESEVSLAGVRSPPLRRIGDPSRDGLAGKRPEMRRKAILPEGCTLCVPVALPHTVDLGPDLRGPGPLRWVWGDPLKRTSFESVRCRAHLDICYMNPRLVRRKRAADSSPN